jgi:hypothetical protein
MAASNWAVILCKFKDDTTATKPLSVYQQLFTGAGSGTSNMVDFFSDVSHGNLDLSGSQVFGWFTLSIDKSAYVGGNSPAPAGSYNRNDLVNLCRTTATNAGVDLSSFNGVVVSMNGQVDLFGYVGGMQAFCDSLSLSPSPLGQEMGHGYGLDHARKDGATQDYQDPWDVMSVYNAYMAPNDTWGTIGPGLNAWCMRSQGWLDESRVWSASSSSFNSVIALRPLHRRDLNGFLAANLGDFLIEYLPQQRWDAGFPRSAVFVHRFADNHSYVMPGTNGNYDLVAADSFQFGTPTDQYSPYFKADVINIDDDCFSATLRLESRPAVPLPYFAIVGRLLGGVAVDAGGGIIVGGQFHPIPPYGPEIGIIQELVNYMALSNLSKAGLRAEAQRATLNTIRGIVTDRINQLQPLRSPAPRLGPPIPPVPCREEERKRS